MSATTVEQLYQQYIQPIPIAEQLHLIALISKKLATHSKSIEQNKHSLLELEGLGAEIWQGIDAQRYVDELRQEWDNPL